jgi:chemotaxis protein histidine kinase CheA
MAENSNPQGTDLYSAQNAIKAMLAPEEDNAAANDALEVETTEVVEEAEASEEMEATEEVDNSVVEGSEEELEVEEDAESSEDESFDILGAIVEVDGEEITVEELKASNLRQRDYTRKTQELAEQRKTLEVQYSEVEGERAQYAQMLPALQQRLEQKDQEPDWDTLYDTDPTMAAKAERQWRKQQDEREVQIAAVKAEQQRVEQLQEQRKAQLKAQFVSQQREMLPDVIPEWRDQKIAAKEATQTRDFLLGEGFTEEDIVGLVHASLVKIARKAMLYDRGETRATAAKAKPQKARAKTLKSGSKASQPRPKNEAQKAIQNAEQSGRVQDAAQAIRALL